MFSLSSSRYSTVNSVLSVLSLLSVIDFLKEFENLFIDLVGQKLVLGVLN